MLQVERQAAFVARRQLPVVVDLLARDRGRRAPRIAGARRLDLDHVGAEIRQHRRRRRAGDPACAVDDFQAGEQAFGHVCTPYVARCDRTVRHGSRHAGHDLQRGGLRRLVAEDDRAGRGEHAADAVADRDLRAGDLRRRDAAHLPHALLQRVHPVHAGVHIRQSAAIGVQRQRSARRGVAAGDERAASPFGRKPRSSSP